jgi:hypothetical protein
VKVAANEGIVLMKFSVKENRSFLDFFFAGEDTSVHALEHELHPLNLSDALNFPEASTRMPCIARKTYTAESIGGGRHAG